MKTKWAMLFAVLVLLALSAAAILMIPRDKDQNVTPLSWATDPNPQRDPQIEAFNRLNPDCFLTIDPNTNNITKVLTQCAAQMGPDLIDAIGEMNIQTYVDAGILMDVTEPAIKMGFGPDTLPPSVRPLVMVKVLTKDGKMVDRQFVYPCNVYHTYIFYNKNIFDKLKVPYPSKDMTWDEYIALAKRLTTYSDKQEELPEIFGGAGASLNSIIFGKGGEFFNEAGTVATVDSKQFVDAFVFMHQLFFKQKVEPSPLQRTGVTSQGGHGAGFINWFGEGKVAMVWGDRWYLINFRRFMAEQREIREKWLKKHPNAKPEEGPQVLRFGCVLVPRFQNAPRYTDFGARSTGINDQSRYRDKALKFLQFLAGPEYSATVNTGSDSKPGNMKYVSVDQFISKEFPGEEEAHRVSIESIPYGRIARRSPFINNFVVQRIISQVSSKMVSEPNLTRDEIELWLQEAADKINLTIARNIKRDKRLQRIYEELLREGAPPIKYNLKEID